MIWNYMKENRLKNGTKKKVGYYNSVWFKIERFLDRHNHLMEFIRTILALAVLTLQFYILTRI
jgi:hypothetical protein